MSKKQYTTIYLVVYDWVDGVEIHDAFTTKAAAQTYIEDMLNDTKRCHIREIRLWGTNEESSAVQFPKPPASACVERNPL